VKVEHPGNAQPCNIGINKSLTAREQHCEATLGSRTGKCRNVLRFLVAVSLLSVLAAGCGGSSPPTRIGAPEVPRALASEWEARASAVADAAAAGDDCHASQLAASLRDDVIAKESQVPARLQSPLLAGVNALADRIVCQVPPQTVTVPPQKPPKHEGPPKPHHKHDHRPGPGGKQGDGG
jgi:hypothetical protein